MNLLPVVRRGITATPVSVDFERRPAFLIDASIFPGSSGSPVFLFNVGSYSPKGKGLVFGNRIFFLGILAYVFIRKDFNTIELIDIPTGKIPGVITTQMVDLGIVYKSIVIKELIEEILRNETKYELLSISLLEDLKVPYGAEATEYDGENENENS